MFRSFAERALLLVTCLMLMAAHSCERVDKPTAREDAKVISDAKECAADADCTLVKDDCCGCNKNGRQRAIAVSDSKAWLKTLSGKCGDTFCAQMISHDPSCGKKAVCEQGKCELR